VKTRISNGRNTRSYRCMCWGSLPARVCDDVAHEGEHGDLREMSFEGSKAQPGLSSQSMSSVVLTSLWC
jgi:hypothetical protein